MRQCVNAKGGTLETLVTRDDPTPTPPCRVDARDGAGAEDLVALPYSAAVTNASY